ncbi:phosphate ABC transporter permease subunit PstC [Actinomarinicola tropica]|uniref:Phosphate transport system permease protein n=1 Tax=Actinomarinicola tropica TaxID=2789776 RepID=A0A5Q2RLA5_9ACTN|nr:phosphate ABC transporter permease subunit PstC [Actinomarinicola tropica]QGG93965.1 phosphate ABC transporter permease subunit PstC [Actinomarinicola tropica]
MTVLSVDDFRGDQRRVRRDAQVRRAVFLAATTSIVVSVLIVGSLLGEAWTFISQVEMSALWTDGWFPRRGMYDLRTVVVGSLLVTGVAMVVAVPLGVGAAIYLSEYADRRVRKFLKPFLEILAGIPSVVLGVFALRFISPEVVQRVIDDASQFNMLAAGIGVGILTIPLIASISEDAMRSVPDSLREASYGMGARKITTVVRVVIPAAISGLVAAFIIAVSRAIGETMVVLIAAGGTGGSLFSTDVTGPGTTLTAAIASQAVGTDQVRGEALTFQSLFFVALLLFLTTLLLNVIANRIVRRVREIY